MPIDAADFAYVSAFVREHSAIVLEPGKEYLVESRLMPIVREHKFASLSALVLALKQRSVPGLQGRVVEAMTTNETSFFRDATPFEALRLKVLPGLIARRQGERRLRVWCGAASSGQEPYSLAILLLEHFPMLSSWDVRIVATDLSREILQKARSGRYTQLEVNRGLPAPLLVKYFERSGLDWTVREPVRRLVQFEEMNLVRPWLRLPPSDLVMLRNVLIYFDVPTKRDILAKVRQVLRPDGYLFLGSAETTMNIDASFERLQVEKASCYSLAAA